MKNKFELGETLKDRITGFKGVAMARCQYFTDCTHYGLCSQELKDGKTMEWEYFDEIRLINVAGVDLIKKGSRVQTSGTSGVYHDPPQM